MHTIVAMNSSNIIIRRSSATIHIIRASPRWHNINRYLLIPLDLALSFGSINPAPADCKIHVNLTPVAAMAAILIITITNIIHPGIQYYHHHATTIINHNSNSLKLQAWLGSVTS